MRPGLAAVTVADDRQLFLDDLIVDRLDGVHLKMHEMVPREIILRLDKPWEGSTSWCPVIIRDGDRYRMWYRASAKWSGQQTPRCVTCYAESKDGIHWERPNLGVVKVPGSKANNICLDEPLVRNAGVFKDDRPGVPEGQRYKAVARGTVKKRGLIYAFASADGIRWRLMRKKPVIIGKGRDRFFDNPPLAFWDARRSRYAIYVRGWRPHGAKQGIRAIRMATSQDFVHWSPLKYVTINNSTDWLHHLYTTSAHPYYRAPIVLMFPKRFQPSRKFFLDWPHKGISDVLLMAARDGVNFSQPFGEAFLRPGLDPKNWHDRAIYIAPNVVKTGEGEMSLYVCQNYRTDSVHFRRYTLREDGFVSVHAPARAGTLLTKPLLFKGSRLEINYSTSAAGSIRVAIQHADGKTAPGYSTQECVEIFGDEISRIVRWRKGAGLEPLAGKPIRLRFEMKEADLYSLRFFGE